MNEERLSVWKRAWGCWPFTAVSFVCLPLWLLRGFNDLDWATVGLLVLNFVFFMVFSSAVGGGATFEELVKNGFGVGLMVTIPMYLFCVVMLAIADFIRWLGRR